MDPNLPVETNCTSNLPGETSHVGQYQAEIIMDRRRTRVDDQARVVAVPMLASARMSGCVVAAFATGVIVVAVLLMADRRLLPPPSQSVRRVGLSPHHLPCRCQVS